MMQSILSMIESASVIVLGVLCCFALSTRLKGSVWIGGMIYGVVFSVIGAIVMSNPVELIPGIRTDPRSAVAVLSGAIGGPVSALITGSFLALVRLSYGGLGALAGATSVMAAALGASLVWAWWTLWRKNGFSKAYIAYQALVALTVPTAVIFSMSQAPTDVFLKSASLFAPTNFVTVLLLGGLIVHEQQRRTFLKEHRETRARLIAIANNAPVMLFQMTMDADNRILLSYVSEGSRRIFGIAPEVLTAKADMLARMLDPADVSRLREILVSSTKSRRRWSFETTFDHASRHRIWLQFNAEPRTDDDGLIVWDGSITDITTQKKNEAMKNEFVATVSHELRTPLTSIHGALGLLVHTAEELPPKAGKLLSVAFHNSGRLKILIDDILDIEKIESGSMPFDMTPSPLAPLLKDAIEANESYKVDENITIEFDNDAPDIASLIDPNRLNQVIDNLLSNAIKYSPPNGTVRVRLAVEDDKASVSISDEGAGIPDEFRHQLFQKFVRAETADNRTRGGTGLGLSICKAIVERMNGTIEFSSRIGVGTTFTVTFPAVETSPRIHGSEAALDRQSVNGLHILYLGADDEIVAALRSLIGSNGTVEAAGDEEKVLFLVGRYDYNFVVCGPHLEDAHRDMLMSLLPRTLVTLDATKTMGEEELSGLLSSALLGVAVERDNTDAYSDRAAVGAASIG